MIIRAIYSDSLFSHIVNVMLNLVRDYFELCAVPFCKSVCFSVIVAFGFEGLARLSYINDVKRETEYGEINSKFFVAKSGVDLPTKNRQLNFRRK